MEREQENKIKDNGAYVRKETIKVFITNYHILNELCIFPLYERCIL